MARARGEHLPYLAYRLRGPGACTACRAPVLARAAVIVGAPGGGSVRVALCLDCQTPAFAAARRGAPVLWALLGLPFDPAHTPAARAARATTARWDGLLDDLARGVIVLVPYSGERERRSLRQAVALRARARGFRVQARYTDTQIALRKDDAPAPARTMRPAVPTTGRHRAGDMRHTSDLRDIV